MAFFIALIAIFVIIIPIVLGLMDKKANNPILEKEFFQIIDTFCNSVEFKEKEKEYCSRVVERRQVVYKYKLLDAYYLVFYDKFFNSNRTKKVSMEEYYLTHIDDFLPVKPFSLAWKEWLADSLFETSLKQLKTKDLNLDFSNLIPLKEVFDKVLKEYEILKH